MEIEFLGIVGTQTWFWTKARFFSFAKFHFYNLLWAHAPHLVHMCQIMHTLDIDSFL